MGFSRQEYWSGLPFPSPVNFPDPGIEPKSPALQANSLPSEPPGKASKGAYFILNAKWNNKYKYCELDQISWFKKIYYFKFLPLLLHIESQIWFSNYSKNIKHILYYHFKLIFLPSYHDIVLINFSQNSTLDTYRDTCHLVHLTDFL